MPDRLNYIALANRLLPFSDSEKGLHFSARTKRGRLQVDSAIPTSDPPPTSVPKHTFWFTRGPRIYQGFLWSKPDQRYTVGSLFAAPVDFSLPECVLFRDRRYPLRKDGKSWSFDVPDQWLPVRTIGLWRLGRQRSDVGLGPILGPVLGPAAVLTPRQARDDARLTTDLLLLRGSWNLAAPDRALPTFPVSFSLTDVQEPNPLELLYWLSVAKEWPWYP